ncbi:MAG TPA: hypothetical protein VHR45_12235 [Thermoanaerobaculia bacterium]|nr:hypothetical protein [Thermoanaerobaculia bacterium]
MTRAGRLLRRDLPGVFPVLPGDRSRAGGAALVLAAALLLWAWVCVPVATGARTFFLRDVFTTHLPLKAFGAAQLRQGSIPAFDPELGLGYPFRGNPNALPFYPGNLLYLVLPFWSAFNLHYALHWLLALFAMRTLARRLGLGSAAALCAGLTYAGSGWMLSALTFYNLLTVAAWWPLAAWGAAGGGRRAIALGGVACGLALLGGEPVTAALGIVPLLAAAVARLGGRRGLASAAAVLGVGAAVALPQLVATLRVLPFTVRGLGLHPSVAANYALAAPRLLELLVPFPFGRPAIAGPTGVWAASVIGTTPLVLTLYPGVIALWLAAAAAARHLSWALLAAAGLALAIAAGFWGELLVRLSFGLFRYPEKFLFWFAFALPLLAGWGLERVVAAADDSPAGRRRRQWVAPLAAGALALGLVAALRLLAPSLLAAVTAGLQRLSSAQRAAALEIVTVQLGLWTVALLAAAVLLLVAALAARRSSGAALVALELAALIQLGPLAATDATAPYRQPAPWAHRLAPDPARGAAVVDELLVFPPWRPDPPYHLPEGRAAIDRMKALDLGAAPGVLYGLTYPLAADLEGMHSPLFALMLDRMPRLSWPERVRWLRSLGLDAAVLFEDPGVLGLVPLDRAERHGVVARLYGVAGPAPRAWWPRRLRVAPSPEAAWAAVSAAADPIAEVTVPRPLPHDPRGSLRLVAETPDRIDLEVVGGGVAVLRRAYQPLYQAHADGQPLPAVAVNLNLLGIVVPPGRHRVTVAVSAWPEWAAAAAALAALAAALALGLARRPYDSAA